MNQETVTHKSLFINSIKIKSQIKAKIHTNDSWNGIQTNLWLPLLATTLNYLFWHLLVQAWSENSLNNYHKWSPKNWCCTNLNEYKGSAEGREGLWAVTLISLWHKNWVKINYHHGLGDLEELISSVTKSFSLGNSSSSDGRSSAILSSGE